ncbi:MAG TPA: NDP-sugar synthase [Actinomycetota bacterium]
MKALILAGGLGTRMRPLTDTVPKSLLPVANRPFLEHQLRLLAQHGITETVLLTGYLAEDFRAFIEEVAGLGLTLEISTEEKPLGTAGAVRSMLEQLDDTFLVLNSDILTDLDLSSLLAWHREQGSLLTIALTPVTDARPYGLVPLDPSGRILDFREKPADPVPGLINAGTYVLEPRALADVPAGEFWMFETQVFPSLLAAGEPLFGYSSDAYWLDIGTPERYRQAHLDVLEGRIKVEVAGELLGTDRPFEHGVVRAPSIVSRPVLIGPGAVVGPGSCLGSNVLVGGRALVQGSVLHDDVRIGVGAVVRDSILGRGARAPVGAKITGEVLA